MIFLWKVPQKPQKENNEKSLNVIWISWFGRSLTITVVVQYPIECVSERLFLMAEYYDFSELLFCKALVNDHIVLVD